VWGECRKYTIQNKCLPHSKHITNPLQSPTGKWCLGKQPLFTVRTMRDTQIHCVGRMQSFFKLMSMVHVVLPLCFYMVTLVLKSPGTWWIWACYVSIASTYIVNMLCRSVTRVHYVGSTWQSPKSVVTTQRHLWKMSWKVLLVFDRPAYPTNAHSHLPLGNKHSHTFIIKLYWIIPLYQSTKVYACFWERGNLRNLI
jgi:hypothetical protein